MAIVSPTPWRLFETNKLMNDWRHFELLEGLRPFSSARAILLQWDGRQYVPTNEEIEIHDFIGRYGDRKNRGYARYSAESSKWEVVGGMREPIESWLPH